MLLLTKTIISKNCEISHLNLGISSFQTEDKQLNFIVNVEKHITDLVKGTVMQIWKSGSIFAHIKEYVEDFTLNAFYFLRYAYVRYVESLLTNILKQ